MRAVLALTLAAHGWGQSRVESQPEATVTPSLRSEHFLRGRKMAAGAQAAWSFATARQQHLAMLSQPRTANLTAAWTPLGPAQVASGRFGLLTGRVTSLAIDPADATGNTLYVGTTGGGVWKSVNAAGPVGDVSFQPLTDTLPVYSAVAGGGVIPSLSIGAIAIGNGVILAGTGDANDASDSYYGAGILRSADAGLTWNLGVGSQDGVAGNHSFTGLGVAGFAFSTSNPSLVVAALSQAVEGDLVNAADATYSDKGLYVSADAGVTWQMATLEDGAQVVQSAANAGHGGNAATAVVWNALRGRFYAAVRRHGYYESADGMTWTRLVHQPGAGLTVAACPPDPGGTGSAACPIFRGALAVQAVTGDTFALSVDASNGNTGLYQDVCGAAQGAATCSNSVATFATAIPSAALEVGNGSNVIEQGDYNLVLAAVPNLGDTLLYAGTLDLFRCSLAGGCVLRNTTNAGNGCAYPARVAPAQHAIAAAALLVYVGNDGGLYRSQDGVAETGGVCAVGDAGHFENLNGGFGSLAEVVSFAQDPVDAGGLLAGLGALGSAGTGTARTSASPWRQLAAGEGGTVAIGAASDWYLSLGAGVNVGRCTRGALCGATDFASVIGPVQTANDLAGVHAPWLLDPGAPDELLLGTCRAWRGSTLGGASWPGANALSSPFSAPAANGCSGGFGVVRSLSAGGASFAAGSAPNVGSRMLYAGMAGILDGGQGVGGHVFSTAAADTATSNSVWTDLAKSPVTNDLATSGIFNPGGFDVSSVTVDLHDATGQTVYATVMGFAGNGTFAPHVYRSVDGGAHWTNISSNLPNAPANGLATDPNDANTVYVALDTGLYVTTAVTSCDMTNCWSIFGTALPNAPVIGVLAAAGVPTGDRRTGELRVATYGRGIWEIPLLTAISPAAAAMTLSPPSLAFAAQQSGTRSASVTVTVTNSGTATLTVTSIVARGDFFTSDTCVGVPLSPQASCTVAVAFAPSVAGTRTGLLTVYGNVRGGQATAALSGIGTAPAAVVLTPLALQFAATTIGAASAVGNVTISNVGTVSANLQSISVSGDFLIKANGCGASLGPSSGCTVSLVFVPTVSGVRNGSLTVIDDGGTQVAQLTGTGTTPPTDTLSGTALSFSSQQLGTASVPQQVMVINAGDTALTLISVATSGDFTAASSCGSSLVAHATCAVAVSYVPRSVGIVTGTLLISDVYRTQTVALTGVGLAPAGVSLSPVGTLDFGIVGVGLLAASQTVTLTNHGGVPLLVSAVTATGDFALVAGTNTCGPTLPPMAVCTVQVSFVPTGSGKRQGVLQFVDNAATSPQHLGLTGTGVDFALALSGPGSVTVASGQTATFAVLLSAAAGSPGNAVFTCSGVPAKAICTVNPATAALGTANGTVVTVTVATGQATGANRLPSMPWDAPATWLACAVPLGLWRLRRVRKMKWGLGLGLVLLAGCSINRTAPSGGAGTLPTPPVTPGGSYALVVAGSSAGLVRSVGLMLVVQ